MKAAIDIDKPIPFVPTKPTGGLLLVRSVLSEQIAWLASLHPRPSRVARLEQLRQALRVLDHERQLRLPLLDGYEPNDDVKKCGAR